MRVSASLILLIFAGALSASAQSLADVARKETDRRQAVKEAGKSYTNGDLKPVPQPKGAAGPVTPADSAAADAPVADGADASGAKPTPKDAAEADTATGAADADAAGSKDKDAGGKDEVKDQAWWAKRMAGLREQLDRDQTFRDALQSRIDALTGDFVNRDDPAQRSQIAADRQKALAELDRVKKSIEDGKRAIPALEEEARREGVAAGWLR